MATALWNVAQRAVSKGRFLLPANVSITALIHGWEAEAEDHKMLLAPNAMGLSRA
jgi:hypothetical protein